METDCNGCGKRILDLNFMECSRCKKLYDLVCLGMVKNQFDKFSEDFKSTWLCPSCSSSLPKGDNSSTPVRSPIPKEIDNVNKKRGGKPQVTKPLSQGDNCQIPKSDVLALVNEVRQLRLEVCELKEQNLDLKNQITACNQLLNCTLMDHSSKIEIAEIKINELHTTVENLSNYMNTQEQKYIRNEIEIIGIPERPNENLYHIASAVSTKIGITLTEDDIDDISRAGPKPLNKAVISRPVVLKLVRRKKCDEIIESAKSRRNITSEGLVDGEPIKIFFNERLTRSNRHLFRAARERARQTHYRYCWVRNGAIFMRRSDGMPAIRISSPSDLDEKLTPMPI